MYGYVFREMFALIRADVEKPMHERDLMPYATRDVLNPSPRLNGVNLACLQMSARRFCQKPQKEGIENSTNLHLLLLGRITWRGNETISGVGLAQDPQCSWKLQTRRKPCRYPHHPYKLASISLLQRSNFAKSRNSIKATKARDKSTICIKAHSFRAGGSILVT